jgi:N-acetylmuramoyl-L-alanine amidase
MTIKIRVITIFFSILTMLACTQYAYGQSATGLRTVVIDPGHGSKDPGALGMHKASTGYHEKDIVLSISLLLGKKIEAAFPEVKVMYTRDTDVFITRNDRAKMANTYADLFISIHCNGNANLSAHGTSVHILGQRSKRQGNEKDYFAQNQDVAQRRNNLIVVDGDEVKQTSIDASETSDVISSSLLWKAIYESSLLFATEVIDKLIKDPLTPRGIVLDQEVVDVLAYTSRPAVLLELGFVTNAKEYNYLKTAAAQEEIAERLFQAFSAYKPVYDSYFNIDFSTQPALDAVPVEASESETASLAVDDTYYGIQVMAGSRELKCDDRTFKGHAVHWVKTDSGIYKYIIGRHPSSEEAKSALADVKKDFPDAFVIKVKGNEVSRP